MNPAIVGLARPVLVPDPRIRYYGTVHAAVAALAGSTPGQNSQNIQIAGQTFVALMLAFSAQVNGVQATRPNILIQLTDSVTNETLFNLPLPIWSIAGDAYNPAVLPIPLIYAANNSVTVTVYNYEANAADVRFSMLGYRNQV